MHCMYIQNAEITTEIQHQSFFSKQVGLLLTCLNKMNNNTWSLMSKATQNTKASQ
jgi:hypothetical protein